MKKSLRERLIEETNAIAERCNQLKGYVEEYKEDGSFENAMKCDIKYRQLKMVNKRLKKLVEIK